MMDQVGSLAFRHPDLLPRLHARDGTVHDLRAWQGGALLPGSFNPLHDGHWGLARAAEQFLGLPIAFELSLVNVDKPELTAAEVQRRLAPFADLASVWLTGAATFMEKACLFPGATFVVGGDTAERIVAPSYYDNDRQRLGHALVTIRSGGCRFLVAGRADSSGRFVRLTDLPIPAAFADLFGELPAELFRLDLCATELRARDSNASAQR